MTMNEVKNKTKNVLNKTGLEQSEQPVELLSIKKTKKQEALNLNVQGSSLYAQGIKDVKLVFGSLLHLTSFSSFLPIRPRCAFSDSILHVLKSGGNYDNSTHCGSWSRNCNNSRVNANANNGGRGVFMPRLRCGIAGIEFVGFEPESMNRKAKISS